MIRLMRAALVVVLASLVMSGCGGSDPILDDAGVDFGSALDGGVDAAGLPGEPFVEVPIGAAATATIGAAGGTLTSTDGHLRLDFPAGALAADTLIEIQQIEWPGGLGWTLHPDGTTFAVPVVATLTFSEAEAGVPMRTTMGGITTLQTPDPSFLYTDGTLDENALEVSVDWRETDAEIDYRMELAHFSILSILVDSSNGFLATESATVTVGEVVDFQASVPSGWRFNFDSRVWSCLGGTVIQALGGRWRKRMTELTAYPSAEGRIEFVGTSVPFPDGFRQALRCTSAGDDLFAYVVVALAAPEAAPDVCQNVENHRGVIRITCVDPIGPGTPFIGDGITISDICQVFPGAGALSCLTPPSTAAAVDHHTAAGVAAHRDVAGGATVYEGVTPEDTAGSSPITIQTSRLNATATHDGTSYQITGLSSGGAFAATDTATVTARPAGATADVTETVAAPPSLGDVPARVLGTLDGLNTEVHFPDGTFDAMYVFATLTGSSLAGSAGIRRYVPAADMTLTGTMRGMPLFDPATVAALAAAGLSVGQITVGPVRTVVNDSFFPTPVRINAGRFVQVDAALLAPPAPLASSDCAGLPMDFPDREAGADVANVCVTELGSCRVTNDTFDSTMCNVSLRERPLVLGNDATGPYATAGAGWIVAWSSNGTIAGMVRPRRDVDESVVVQHQFDARRFRVVFRATATGYSVTSVAPFTGTFPPYGASTDCADVSAAAPQIFGTPSMSSGYTVYARLCIDTRIGTCFIHGAVESTPENEECPRGYAAGFGHESSTMVTYAMAGFPTGGGGGWTVGYTSAGTSDGTVVTGIPADTAVSTRFHNGFTTRWSAEYAWNGTAFTFTSAVNLP